MNTGFWILFVLLVVLFTFALYRQEDFGPVLKRLLEQAAKLVPRMVCALIAAGFIAELLPKEEISHLMGENAGIWLYRWQLLLVF